MTTASIKHTLSVLVRNASLKAVLTSTDNLCFRAKIRKIMYITIYTPVLQYESGV